MPAVLGEGTTRVTVRRRWLAVVALFLVVGGGVAAFAYRRHVGAQEQEKALFAARRAQVCELAPADVNRDGVLDLIVAFGPTMEDRPGTRFSTLEAYDGRSKRVLWTSRLPRWVQCDVVDNLQSVVVGRDHVVFTWDLPETSPQRNGIPALSVHELATGRLVWQTSFPASSFWVGLPFRVWLAGDQLLVLSNTHQDRSATTDHVLHAFDLASGAKRWEQPIAQVQSTPWIVDGTVVLMSGRGISTGPAELAQIVFIETQTGATSRTPVAQHGWQDAVVGENEILLRCESFDDICSATVDQRKPAPDTWLAKVDFRTRTLRPVTLADGSPQPLDVTGDRLARYGDTIIEGSAIRGWLAAMRVGDAVRPWRFEGVRLPLHALDDTMERAAHAAHLHRIPGRYVPLFVDDEDATRIVVLDLETGTPTWKSDRLTPRRSQGFIVHGTRYYVNVELGGLNTLLVLDANSGKFVAAQQVTIGGASHSPNALADYDQPDPRYFHGGHLLGHRYGPEWWMIDLATDSLVASPGVELVSRWDEAERVLGPLPRALVSR